ncbi:MAG TPA: trypsin-like peptidase domain-containing protein [Jatrophihabitantaceae bacterium]|jgi:putative serine protease PepD
MTGNLTPQPPDADSSTRARLIRLLGPVLAIAAVGLAVAALVIAVHADDKSAGTTGSTSACPVTTIAEQELPSVVTISVTGPSGSGTGSGEVIDTSGHILTNNHVISPAASGGTIGVLFSDGRSQAAHLVGRDPQTDLAVLQVQQTQGLRPIQFGSSQAVRVGQSVVALGAPLGLSSTVTAGIVSALDRSVNVPADDGQTALLVAAIQTDAAINPGNSGGALVDCAGDLIGVPTAGATVPNPSGGSSVGNIGLGFAIPSDFAHSIAQELIAHGSVTHGFLGVSVDTAPEGTGLYVVAVTPGGPAASAGLQVGDVITKIDGESASSAEQLLELTLTHKPGDTVTVTYERQGETQETRLTLGSR